MRLASTCKDLAHDEAGIAAVEFAVIFPVLLILMLGGIQLVTFINATRKVELVATSISEMISQASPPLGSTIATVNTQDIRFSWDSAMLIFPYLMTDAARKNISSSNDIEIDYASIKFTNTSNSCGSNADKSSCYVANVVWTSPGSGSNYRPCILPQQPTSSTTPSPATLPNNVFGPESLVAIDVVFNFQTTFGSQIIGPQRIARSVYVQPRYATLIKFDPTNTDGSVIACPGF